MTAAHDHSKYRPGDTVHVAMKVAEGCVPPWARGKVFVGTNDFKLFVEPCDIVAHIPAPRPIEVGSKVKVKLSGMLEKRDLVVRAMAGKLAWVEDLRDTTDFALCTYKTSALMLDEGVE